MNKITECLVRSIPLAALIICIGYLIVFFILQNSQKLGLTLFVLGTIPIVMFLPSVFSQSKSVFSRPISGDIHNPKVIFRKVDTLEKKEKQIAESIVPALSYVLAGVIIWVFSLVIY